MDSIIVGDKVTIVDYDCSFIDRGTVSYAFVMEDIYIINGNSYGRKNLIVSERFLPSLKIFHEKELVVLNNDHYTNVVCQIISIDRQKLRWYIRPINLEFSDDAIYMHSISKTVYDVSYFINYTDYCFSVYGDEITPLRN